MNFELNDTPFMFSRITFQTINVVNVVVEQASDFISSIVVIHIITNKYKLIVNGRTFTYSLFGEKARNALCVYQ